MMHYQVLRLVERGTKCTADIVEGTAAVFEVRASLPSDATATGIMVDVQISQVGQFLNANPRDTERTVSVMSGATADLTVMTEW